MLSFVKRALVGTKCPDGPLVRGEVPERALDSSPGASPGISRREPPWLGPLGGHKVHKMVKFRPRGMVDKREMEQAQLFETADERGCTPMFGAAHRRGSACIGGSLPSAV